MPTVLIVGGTRGLGASLAKLYANEGWVVYATWREFDSHGPSGFPPSINWLVGIDLLHSDVGDGVAWQLKSEYRETKLDVLIISAGIFEQEKWDGEGPKWEKQVEMYKTSSVSPLFIVHRLVKAGVLGHGSKVVLVSSEAGSIALRTSAEMNYGHHASKAALNMIGKLLSFDLRSKSVAVSIVHPGFMRTEMTRDVGLEAVYDKYSAVTPDEAGKSLMDWIQELDMTKSGQLWAPRGPIDIGTAEEVMGKDLPTPLELPW